MIKQITVTLPNKPGKLSEISDLMGSEGLNIRAILVDHHNDTSVLRYIVEDPEKAGNLLRSRGYDFQIDEVLAVEVPDHPGGLGAVLRPLREHNINVDYMYPAIGRYGLNAILIMGVSNKDEAIRVLKQSYIQLLKEEVYKL